MRRDEKKNREKDIMENLYVEPIRFLLIIHPLTQINLDTTMLKYDLISTIGFLFFVIDNHTLPYPTPSCRHHELIITQHLFVDRSHLDDQDQDQGHDQTTPTSASSPASPYSAR